MFAEITNITDAPGKRPTELEIFGKKVLPGESLKVSAALIDSKTARLATGDNAVIAIGALPSWYESFKKRRGREMTQEEFNKKLAASAPPSASPKDEDKPKSKPKEK